MPLHFALLICRKVVATRCVSGKVTLANDMAELCEWAAAAKDLPMEFPDSKKGPVRAQQRVMRKGGGLCIANLRSGFDHTTQGQHDATWVRSSYRGPAGAFLTAILGRHMTRVNCMFVGVWYRLGHHIPAH